jgi:hypothetical protein
MTLMRMYPIERVDHPERPRPFANGQFMLFRREAYERIGGHAAVREALLEDIAFAQRVSDEGGAVALMSAGSLLIVSMYETFGAFRRGWRRIFIEACRRRPGRMRKNAIRTLVVGVLLPLSQVVLAAWACTQLFAEPRVSVILALGVAVCGLTLECTTLLWLHRLLGAPPAAVLFHPLGSLVVADALWRGASDLVHRRPVRWGGKDYVLAPR